MLAGLLDPRESQNERPSSWMDRGNHRRRIGRLARRDVHEDRNRHLHEYHPRHRRRRAGELAVGSAWRIARRRMDQLSDRRLHRRRHHHLCVARDPRRNLALDPKGSRPDIRQ
ncbi:hypothetical protein chiPu_0028243 [Chiloscyllium punctatum]|uniref:Uncharacterized protein n=1 Tax=Chiloscyllium punctatum TaxID=137246 RepID=A0A401TN63_CHIPU|nr:hypothetical protein [Chiloscyllium punctatum]